MIIVDIIVAALVLPLMIIYYCHFDTVIILTADIIIH